MLSAFIGSSSTKQSEDNPNILLLSVYIIIQLQRNPQVQAKPDHAIVSNNKGGSGRLTDLNGYPQNSGVNRGIFRVSQAGQNAAVQSTGNDVHVYTRLVYDQGTVPTSVVVSDDRTGSYTNRSYRN